MEKLIVLSEDGVSEEFPLVEQRISIGREESNVICLGDKSVSRHHATLQRVFSGFTIQDEGSTNGTRVNGRVITKQFLKHRDLIEIGNYHLRFLEEAPKGLAVEDTDKTTVIRPVQQSKPTTPPQQSKPASPLLRSKLASAPERPRPSQASTPVEPTKPDAKAVKGSESAVPKSEDKLTAKIRYLAGQQKGEEVVVDRAFFSVGNPGGDLVLINKRNTGYFLLKVGGDAPPTVNGTPIKAGGVELHNGDRIDLGELSLEFRL
jgi:pSer/pThr/pTyr-binding forkhead associated (FHA) protein